MVSNKTTGDKSPIIMGNDNKIIYSEERKDYVCFKAVEDLECFFEDTSDKILSNYRLVSYYGWHETDGDWLKGNGELIAITFGEINYLWDNRDVFYDYEANVLRFMLNGGTISRAFVISGMHLKDSKSFNALCRVIYRHAFLGMKPKIVPFSNINRIRNIVKTQCHSIGTLNGHLGYFFYNRQGNVPEILRTTCKNDIERIDRAIFEIKLFWQDALNWLKKTKIYEVEESALDDAEKDADIVRYLSSM